MKLQPYRRAFAVKEKQLSERRDAFTTTGISNIDDKYHGVNLLHGGYSIGYFEFDNYKDAEKFVRAMDKLFTHLNKLQVDFDLDLDFTIAPTSKSIR